MTFELRKVKLYHNFMDKICNTITEFHFFKFESIIVHIYLKYYDNILDHSFFKFEIHDIDMVFASKVVTFK